MSEKKPVKYQSRKAEIYRSPTCLNCGAELRLTDKYCPQCSQLNTTKQLSLKDFFGEFFSSIFVYDSRLRYTLKDLLFKPGVITRNYVNGQRLKYANPFRFFLSISIVYFLLISLKLSTSSYNLISVNYNENDQAKDSTLIESKTVNEDTLSNILEERIEIIPESQLDTLPIMDEFVEKISLYSDFYEKNNIEDVSKALDSLHHNKNWFNKWLYNRGKVIRKVEENPNDFVGKLLDKMPFFLFFFAPFFALFFWLFYSKKTYTYMEHLVFVFNLFSFVFLSLVIVFIVSSITGVGYLKTIVILILFPLYFYKAMRHFYNQRRAVTIVKFLLFNFILLIGVFLVIISLFTATILVF